MYQSYFGLAEAPFSIAPAPRFLYMSQRHQEALAHLLYGMGGDGGFVLLTGEVGAGKTTVSRSLLDQMPEACDLAYVFNPKLTVEELLSTICVEFGIEVPDGNTSIKVFVDRINAYLLDAHARGRHSVLIIDEAQNLSADVLEQMRLLTNLETSERKLLQIILLGQPELAILLARPELRQLAQRIVARYHLGSLSKPEVAAYVRHRLEVAGTQRPLFPAAIMSRIYRLSGGVPRIINVLCDRALLGAYAQGKERVDRATLAQAAREVFGEMPEKRTVPWRVVALAGVLLAVVVLALPNLRQGATPRAAARPPAPVVKVAAPSRALEWPAGLPFADSLASAYAALLHAWGVPAGAGELCQQATAAGLRCRAARGGLDDLRQTNRPAVLRMNDEQGHEFQATLTALSDKTATFTVAGATRVVALSALATQWSGHYTLLWRVPPQVTGTLRVGERSAAVDWLREQMDRLHKRPPGAVAQAPFDADLMREVRQFQLEQGLIPDGNVGQQTLMRLAGALDRAAPTLVATRGAR